MLFSKVMISAKDEPDVVLPPAVDGLLRVHKRITDGLDVETDQPQLQGYWFQLPKLEA
jgi:hypothetical protein